MNKVSMGLLVCLAAGCVPSYRPPTYAEPHAILKFRRSYAYSAGISLSEQLLVNGQAAYVHTVPTESAQVPRNDAVLIHPRAARLSATSTFFHNENRLVQESYTVQTPTYSTESYSCGTGKSYQTCTRSVTHYSSETRYRTVTRSVRVTDAECTRERTLAPANQGVYLLELNFQAPGVCRLSCFEQFSQPDGSFDNRPCPYPAVQKQ